MSTNLCFLVITAAFLQSIAILFLFFLHAVLDNAPSIRMMMMMMMMMMNVGLRHRTCVLVFDQNLFSFWSNLSLCAVCHTPLFFLSGSTFIAKFKCNRHVNSAIPANIWLRPTTYFLYWTTIPPNFTSIRYETTEPRLFEECRPNKNKKNKMSRLAMGSAEMESSRPWPWPRGSSRPTNGVLGLGLGCQVLHSLVLALNRKCMKLMQWCLHDRVF